MKKIYLSLLFLAAMVVSGAAFSSVAMAQDLPDFDNIFARLGSDDMGQRRDAHREWQKINMQAGSLAMEGNKILRDAVNKAAREALEADNTPVGTRVELLQQLQWTGTDAEVAAMAKQLKNAEYTVRDEAVRALATLPGNKGVDALKKALESANAQDKKIIQDVLAQLKPDLRELKEAGTMGLAYADAKVVEDWMKKYDGLSLEDKIGTLDALTVRGDRKYKSFAVAAVKMEPENDNEIAKLLKRSGLLALEKLATKSEVPLMIDLAQHYDRGLAIEMASRVETPGFDEALLNAMGTTQDGNRIGIISDILARRNSGAALDKVLAEAKDPNCPDRLAMFTNAVAIAGNDKINDLLDIFVLFPAGKEREAAEKLIVGRCGGNSGAVRGRLGDEPAKWYSLLGRIGDDGAWEVIKAGILNDATRDAAVTGLCNFPHAKYAGAMREIFEDADGKFNDAQKLRALRAFIRVVSLPTTQGSVTDKLDALRVAMEKATRDDERKLILSRLSAIRDVESAKFAYEFVKVPALETDAYRALADLAHHNNIRRPNKEYFIPVLDEIIAKCKDQGIVERCKKYRDMMD